MDDKNTDMEWRAVSGVTSILGLPARCWKWAP